MNSACRNRALESRLVGHWTCASEREKCEYAFMPANEFLCTVTRPGEGPFKVRGYWDVLGNQLRLGASALHAESGELEIRDPETFAVRYPHGKSPVIFKRG